MPRKKSEFLTSLSIPNVYASTSSRLNGCFYVGQSIGILNADSKNTNEKKGASFTFWIGNNRRSYLSLSKLTGRKSPEVNDSAPASFRGYIEDFFVMKYIREYGVDKVKGGTFLS